MQIMESSEKLASWEPLMVPEILRISPAQPDQVAQLFHRSKKKKGGGFFSNKEGRTKTGLASVVQF